MLGVGYGGFAACVASVVVIAFPAAAQTTLSWGPTGAGGSGTWDNTSANWFNGSTGVPWASGGNAVFGGTAGTVTVNGTVAAGGATFNTNGYVINGGTLTLSETTPTITTNTGASATVNSLITGSAALVKSGPGTLTINNAGNSYTGGTTVSQGTLVFGGGGKGALGNGTVTLGDAHTGTSNVSLLANFPNFLSGQNIHNNIVVSNSGTGTVSIGTTSFSPGSNGTIFDGTITLNRDVTFVGGNTDRTSFNGKITGTGNITLTGSRITLFNNTNDFVGSVTISPGNVLQTDRAFVLPSTTTLNILGNGVLQFSNNSDQTIDGLNGSQNAVIRVITGGPPKLAVGASNGSGVYAGLIQNVISSFTKLGTGTQVLSGANTYVGVTRISGGVLSTPLLANGGAASGIGASTSAAANLVLDGGTLQYTGTGSSTNRLFTLTTNGGGIDASGSGPLSGAGARSLILSGSNTGANTFASVLADNGGPTSLVKTGAGTWGLTAANSYTGATSVLAGTLALSGAGSVAPSSGVRADGVFDISGVTAATSSIQTLSGAGGVNLGAKTLNLTNAHDTFAGAIQGAGRLAVLAGTETLTGANTYSGGTTIANGATLQLGNGGSSGSIVGDVTDSGTLAFNRADTVTFGGVISGTGGLSQIGAGTTVLNVNNPYSGPTQVLAGTLAIGDPTHSSAALSGGGLTTVSSGATLGGYGTVAGDVVNNGTIAVANAVSAFSSGPTGTFIIGGNVTNSGLINLAGSMPGNVLKIGGNYTGTAGSSVLFNTLLNAGGPLSSQFTDRLLISGNADPSTVIVHPSGSGAFTSTGLATNTSGISLIQVAGSSYSGAFTLPGGYITGGTPFQYRLNAYGPGSAFGTASPSQNLVGNPGGYWDFRLQNVYLTPSGDPATPGSDPDKRRLAVAPQVLAYIGAPTALFNAGLLDIDELHRRLGEIRDSQAAGPPKTAEVFARAYGNTMTYRSNRSFADYGTDATESYAAFQAGASGIVRDDDFGTLRLGLAFSYGHLQFDPNAPEGFSEGNFNSEKLSAIATYQARAGWYLDGIVSGGWFDGTIGTSARGSAAALTGSSIGASLEGGYPIALGWQKLQIEPQVQVSWQHLMFNRATDVDSLTVGIGALDQGVVRAGGRIVRPFETDDGRHVTPYLKVNLLQGFADGGAIDVSGFKFDTGQYGTAIQMGGGITGMLTANLAVYGDVSYQHEVSTGGFRGWAFNGGVRYSF